jgi:glycosyltransferase involved in cell wall biosynthesis
VEPLERPPRFSIVIPAYQAAETVGDAICSALEQTHPAHEVIVVDDGSTDDTYSVLKSFGERIRTIHQENRGAAGARNTAMAAAEGDFLVILDADDAYHPRRLEVLAELATARSDLDLITTDARLVAHGKTVGTFATFTPFEVEGQRSAIFDSCFVGGWPAVRLDRLRAINGFDEGLRIAHDWDCWLRLILAGAGAGMIDAPYYEYVLHSGSLSANRAPSLWERAQLTEKALSNPNLRPEERPALMRAIRMHRSRAVEAEAQAALFAGGDRRPLPRLAVSRRLEPRARIAALLSATAPPLARRIFPEWESAEDRLPTVEG